MHALSQRVTGGWLKDLSYVSDFASHIRLTVVEVGAPGRDPACGLLSACSNKVPVLRTALTARFSARTTEHSLPIGTLPGTRSTTVVKARPSNLIGLYRDRDLAILPLEGSESAQEKQWWWCVLSWDIRTPV